MRLLMGVAGTVGLGSIISVLLILARLTQKWEAVTGHKSGYRLFYAATALVALACLARLVRVGYLDLAWGTYDPSASVFSDPKSWFYVCTYHIPLVLGMTISLALTCKNWGWLFRGRNR